MLVTLNVRKEFHKNAIVVPRTAVFTTDTGSSVYTVSDGKAKAIPVSSVCKPTRWRKSTGRHLAGNHGHYDPAGCAAERQRRRGRRTRRGSGGTPPGGAKDGANHGTG